MDQLGGAVPSSDDSARREEEREHELQAQRAKKYGPGVLGEFAAPSTPGVRA
jgi:hypothetical protein